MLYWSLVDTSGVVSNSCNMGMKALPDMYARQPEATGRGHTYQAKPELPRVTTNM